MSRLAQGRTSSPLSISGRPLSVLAWLLGAVVSFSVAVYGLKMCMDGEVREGLFIGVVFAIGGVLFLALSWSAWYRLGFWPEYILIEGFLYRRRIPSEELEAFYFIVFDDSKPESQSFVIELKGRFSALSYSVSRRFDTEGLIAELGELYPGVSKVPREFVD